MASKKDEFPNPIIKIYITVGLIVITISSAIAIKHALSPPVTDCGILAPPSAPDALIVLGACIPVSLLSYFIWHKALKRKLHKFIAVLALTILFVLAYLAGFFVDLKFTFCLFRF